MNHPEATQQALSILRSGQPFQWYVITLLALAVYVYFSEIAKHNWQGVAAGLSLYAVHWLYEIANALIQHFTGHARSGPCRPAPRSCSWSASGSS